MTTPATRPQVGPFSQPARFAGQSAPLYDLRSLLRRTGRAAHGAALNFPEERVDSLTGVEIVDAGPAPIHAIPAPVTAFLDGIQSQILLAYRQHRPVALAFAAAGAAGAGANGARLLDLVERISIVAAEADLEWVETVNDGPTPLPVAQLPNDAPPVLARAVLEHVGQMRATCEAELRNRVLANTPTDSHLVLDGSLLGSETDTRLAGVVKSVRTRYLADETELYGLRVGWRSSIFKLPPAGGTAPRYTCYLRLHDASNSEWSFGLIRLEAFTPEQLPGLAARALAERQGQASGDGRWDRHLVSVAMCERLLRARRPVQFAD